MRRPRPWRSVHLRARERKHAAARTRCSSAGTVPPQEAAQYLESLAKGLRERVDAARVRRHSVTVEVAGRREDRDRGRRPTPRRARRASSVSLSWRRARRRESPSPPGLLIVAGRAASRSRRPSPSRRRATHPSQTDAHRPHRRHEGSMREVERALVEDDRDRARSRCTTRSRRSTTATLPAPTPSSSATTSSTTSTARSRSASSTRSAPPARTSRETRRCRAALRVLSNLERIGDAAAHIAKHCDHDVARSRRPSIEFPIDDLAELADRVVRRGRRRASCAQDLELAKVGLRARARARRAVRQEAAAGDGAARPRRRSRALPAARAGRDEVPGEDRPTSR